MKTMFTFLLFINCMVISAQAQFIDFNRVWTESYSCFGSPWTTSYRYKLDSTVYVFNNVEYYQILKSENPDGDQFEGTENYIRTDSLQQLVYIYQSDGDELLYDFTLMVGDTFQTSAEFDCDFIVGEKDTITLLNGEEREKWIFYFSGDEYHPEFSFGYPHWIEGIGSSYGLTTNDNMCFFDGCGSHLLCVHEDGELVLMNSDTCWLIISSENHVTVPDIRVYPNPSASFIQIEDENDLVSSIQVIDLSGRILIDTQDDIISTANLSTGSYVMRMVLHSGKNTFQRFVKI